MARGRALPPQWRTRRSTTAHVALAIWLPGCAIATWWQVGVALSGDSLGWVYSIMWPAFAVCGVVLWWGIVHDDPEAVGVRGLRHMEQGSEDEDSDAQAFREEQLAQAEREDPELAEYNAYLAELARSSQSKTWRSRHSG